MAKLTQEEYLNNIRNIINEGMSDNPIEDASDRFHYSKYIASLLSAAHDNPKLMDFLITWDNHLRETNEPEFLSFEAFYNQLKAYSKGTPEVKYVLGEMKEILSQFGDILEVLCCIQNISDPVAQATIKDAYNEYLNEPTSELRREVVEACWTLVEQGDPNANRIISIISDENNYEYVDDYSDDDAQSPAAQYDSINERINKIREEKKVKRTQEKLEAYANKVFEDAKVQAAKEKEINSFNHIVNNTGINLTEAVKSIVNSDAKKNKRLMAIVEQYAGALNDGLYEERLYETFIHNVTPFNYLLPVEKAINSINEAVKKNPTGIEITKILEEMAESQSYNILPLIEEDCARYVNTPNPTNRVQLRNCLVSFANDPYVSKILEVINNDNSKEANTLSEKALSIADEIKLVKQHAHTENIYSPVQYIKEGESVFYTNGQYFVRKGQNIAKIGPELIKQLSEKFTTLCKLVNDPNVSINEDHIVLRGNDKTAKIYEGYAEVNGNKESTSTLRNLQEMGMKYDYDTNFFIMCSCLLENFNKIAKIDFGRRIALNNNPGVNADLFRIGDNIFINTVNEDTCRSTFYHNVNPLQCKNIINDHMGLNVANLFENLLPAQNKIIMKLNETQNEYQDAIERYEETLDKLKKAKEAATSDDSIKKLEDGIKTAEDKLKDLKSEYKEWQKKVADETGSKDDSEDSGEDEVNGDGDVKKETTNEPLDDKDIDNAMDDLTTPIDGNIDDTSDDMEVVTDYNEVEDSEDDENPMGVSDDEFDSYLNGEDTDDTDTADSDNNESPILNITTETEPVDNTDEDSDSVDDAIADYGFEGGDNGFTEFDDAFGDDEVEGESDDVEDDDINVEPKAEDVPSDEDIITDDVEDTEDYADMATDMFGGDTENPVPEEPEYIPENEMVAKVASVRFDENIKTHTLYKSGTVSVIIPMVDKDGKVYNDTQKFDFYLGDDGEPIIDNDEMQYNLYTTIVDNIKASTQYKDAVNNGTEADYSGENEYQKSDSKVNEPKVRPSSLVDLTDDTEPEDDYSDENEDPSGVNDFFNVIDTDDEFTITPKDDFEDIPTDDELPQEDVIDTDLTTADVPTDDTDFDSFDDVHPDEEPVIPTYKVGDTEIELPAPTVDDTDIPEKYEAKPPKRPVTESRKSILGIGAVHKTASGKSRFFVNEDTTKSSKLARYGSKLIREKIGGATNSKGFINESVNNNPIYSIYEYCTKQCKSLHKQYGDDLKSDFFGGYLYGSLDKTELSNTYFFTIKNETARIEYAVYGLPEGFYVRPIEEFLGILKDLEDEVPEQIIDALAVAYTDESDEPIFLGDGSTPSDWKFGIDTVLKTMIAPMPDELLEHARIRRFGLSAGHNFENTKMADDILHGDKVQRDFEDKVEKDTQEAGVDNPLAPMQAQEEAFVPVLPNAHRKMTISEMKAKYDITYEPNDKVIYKKEKASIISIDEKDGTANIIGKEGKQMTVNVKDLEPDPEYLNDLEVLPDEQPDNIDKPLKNEEPQQMKDLNKKNVECNIIMDKQKVNMTPCLVPVEEIKESKSVLTVINEDGVSAEYNVDNIEFKELPYAVVVNAEGEPIRKIRIDPTSYINAEDNDMVKCYAADKEVEYPKKAINILS